MRLRLAAVIALAIATLWAGYPDPAVARMGSFRLSGSHFYIRHNFNLGKVTPVTGWFHSAELDRSDATFVMHHPGLAGGNPNDTVSLEALNFRGKFLRHRFSRVRLDVNDGSDLFRKDATFNFRESGCTEIGKVGRTDNFESVNYPGYFINARLVKSANGTPLSGGLWMDRSDGTYEGQLGLNFVLEPPLADECVRLQGPCPY